MRLGTARIATPEMVAEANPPAGFEPITSTSPFGWNTGPIFEIERCGRTVRGFRVMERHANMGGFCHGGMMMTFADIIMGNAVFGVAKPPFVTIRMTTDFIAPSPVGAWVEGWCDITGIADGVVTGQGQMEIDRRAVAAFSGAFMVKAISQSEKSG